MANKIYSCAYPIWHEFDTDGTNIIDYHIWLDGEEVYTGHVSAYSAREGKIKIDLSDIFRVYLQTFYEQLPFNGLMEGYVPTSTNNKATIQEFVVDSEYNSKGEGENSNVGDDKTYTVIYDYNKDYNPTCEEKGIRNYPISTIVDPRQYISIVSYNLNATGQEGNSYEVKGKSSENYPYRNKKIYNHLIFRPNDKSASDGDTIILRGGGDKIEYSVKESCGSRYALYYVNLLGGLDTILCEGKYVKSFGVSRTDAALYNDRNSRMGFQTARIHQEISNKYKLNIGWLNEDKMDRIDHLIYSPKVWIHDLEKDTVTSCVIDDTNYTVKSFRNDRLLFYTINVTESQKYMVR